MEVTLRYFDAINAELAQYSPELATRPQIVVANKTDIMEDEALLEKLRAHVEEAGYPLFALSAASHTGTRELVLKIAEKLSTLPPVTVYEPEYVPRPPKLDTSAPLNITVSSNNFLAVSTSIALRSFVARDFWTLNCEVVRPKSLAICVSE